MRVRGRNCPTGESVQTSKTQQVAAHEAATGMPKRGPPSTTSTLAQPLRAEARVAQGFFSSILGRIDGVMPEPTGQLRLLPFADDPFVDDIVAKSCFASPE